MGTLTGMKRSIIMIPGTSFTRLPTTATQSTHKDVRFYLILEVRRSWTPHEDAYLIRLIEKHGARNWTKIAENLPGRVGKQCR
jgi:hypothetical protein